MPIEGEQYNKVLIKYGLYKTDVFVNMFDNLFQWIKCC